MRHSPGRVWRFFESVDNEEQRLSVVPLRWVDMTGNKQLRI